MVISRLSRVAFRLEMKGARADVVVLIDPPSDGRRLASAEIILWTERQPAPSDSGGSAYIISEPGEYERRGVTINGIVATHTPHAPATASWITTYSIFAEGVHLLYLGDTNQADWNGGSLEQVGDVDVLCVPIGGHGMLNAEGAQMVIKVIEPKVVVPILYADGDTKGYDGLEAFLKKTSGKPIETNKLRITPRDFPSEGITYYVVSSS